MMAERDTDIRRILVALDATSGSLEALEEAAALASRMEAELVGMFVEDIGLLSLASLPFAREVSPLGSAARTLDVATVEKELKLQAAQARRALAETAERLHLRWEFLVARGKVDVEILAATARADMVALAKSRAGGGRPRLGQVSRAVALSMPCSVLLATPDPRPHRRRVAVVFGAGPASEAALRFAIRLATGNGCPLSVLVPAAVGETEAAGREAAANQRLRGLAVPVEVRRISLARSADMMAAVAEVGAEILVLGATPREGPDLVATIEGCGCTVLLVRGEA
jgi:nucleotide-binding universal stress UspA family protein